jgi:hypothetical protein
MGNEVFIQQLDIISPDIKRTIHLGYNLGDLKASRADRAAAMSFAINVDGDVNNRVIPIINTVITGLGFPLSSDGVMQVNGDFTMDKVDRGNDFVNFKWYLFLDLIDDRGMPVLSFEGDFISAGMTESAAISRTYKDVEEEIQRQFRRELNNYFNSFIEK